MSVHKVSILLFVLELCTVGWGSWQPQPDQVTNTDTGNFWPSVWVDSDGKVHVLFCAEPGGNDPAWQLSHSWSAQPGKWSPPFVLDTEHDCRSSEIVGNGNHIVAVQGAFRKHYGHGCTESKSQTDGCSDFYFLESTDGGSSWTSPVALPHGKDYIQRYGPHVALLPDESVFVLGDWQNQGSVYYIRAPTSTEFSQEASVPSGLSSAQAVSLDYTTQEIQELQMVVIDAQPHNGHLNYLRFNGSSWSTRLEIHDNAAGPDIFSDGSTNIFATWSTGNHGNLFGSMSLDRGRSWSTDALPLQQGDFYAPSGCFVNGGKEAYVTFVGPPGCPSQVLVGAYNGTAWTDLKQSASEGLNCASNPDAATNKKEIVVTFHGKHDSDYWNIYVNRFSLAGIA